MYQKVTKMPGKSDIVTIPQFKSYGDFRTKTLAYMADISNYLNPSKYFKNAQNRADHVEYTIDLLERNERRAREITGLFLRHRDNELTRLIAEPAGQYDVIGQSFDIGRILSGDPECMVNYYQNVSEKSKYLEIIFNVAMPKWVAVGETDFVLSHLFAYYSPMLDLIDQWEQNGTRCRIIVDISSKPYRVQDPFLYASFVLKEYEDIMDMELFCKVFMTHEMTNLGFPHIMMSECVAPDRRGVMSSYSAPADYNAYGQLCNYNPALPTTIRIPSTGYLQFMNFDYLTGIELLKAFGYPVSQY